MSSLNLHQLTFEYQEGQPILHNLTLSLPLHTTILLSGPVGCGKTTLLKIIAGLLPKYGGKLTGTVELPEGQRISMLFQDPAMQFTMDTPRHELEFTLENLQVPQANIADRVKTALDFVGLTAIANQRLTTLSGGQLQRVALAITVAMNANIILLDEPFASIDEANRQFLLKKLMVLQQQRGTTIIISDHDLHGYQDFCKFVVQFNRHRASFLSLAESQSLLMTATQAHHSALTVTIPQVNEPAVKLTNYSVTRNHHLLMAVNRLGIANQKITLLTGPSGAGKSTLLSSIAKLTAYSGTISYHGKNIQRIFPGKYYQQVGLLFQETNQQFLNVTVGEELTLSLCNGHHPFFNGKTPEQVLALVGLPDLTNRVVYSLSGGQRKLVQNLSMLLMGQRLLLMDEPFTGLDRQSLSKLLTLFRDSRQALEQTILIVSHQLTELDGLIDHHLLLNKQQLSYQGD